MSPILYALIFVGILLAGEGLRSMLEDRSRRDRASSRKRLKRMASSLRDEVAENGDEESLLRSSEKVALGHRLGSLFPGRRALGMRLYRSGSTETPGRFLLKSCAMGLAGALAGQIFFPATLQGWLPIGLAIVPFMGVRRAEKKRARDFEAQFPDALDLLIRSLRAGHSLSAGLRMIGSELPDPVGVEFAQLADEVQLGLPVNAALMNLVGRIDSEDLPFFATAIAIQQETGSNLAEVLDNLSYVIRERFKVYGKVRALTAMGRASANLLAGWPLVMVGAMYMTNPGYIAPLWETPQGHMMMVVSAVMVLIGWYGCRKMAEITV
jgi:tight adherence protein B